jgi:hypothetical protein
MILFSLQFLSLHTWGEMTFAVDSISLNCLPNTGAGTKGRYRKLVEDIDVYKYVTQD